MWHGRVFCRPHEGFGDRLRVICFAYKMARMHDIPLSVAWENDSTCGVDIDRWFDTDFEVVPGDHPRPERQCIIIDCDGALTSPQREQEPLGVLPLILRPKVRGEDLSGRAALHIRATDIEWREPSRHFEPQQILESLRGLAEGKPIVLFTDKPAVAEALKDDPQIERVACPPVESRSAEGCEEATIRDWLAMSSCDIILGTRSNFSLTAAAFGGKPYHVLRDNTQIMKIFPPSYEPDWLVRCCNASSGQGRPLPIKKAKA